jgi:hypothetical protein
MTDARGGGHAEKCFAFSSVGAAHANVRQNPACPEVADLPGVP